MTVITLRGTHGTATEFAAAIGASGFKPSETGRAGGGVYLWAYVSDEDHAIALAEDWWQRERFAKGAGRVEASKVFDDYIAGIARYRASKGQTLKVVEVMVPFPRPSKKKRSGHWLTTGADAFIVLLQGLSILQVVRTIPERLS